MNKHIKKLSLVVKTGVGIFMVSGLSGCTPQKCVKGNAIYTGNRVQECLDKGGELIVDSYGSSSSHGTAFVPLSTNNSSSKSSGYFSSTSTSSSFNS